MKRNLFNSDGKLPDQPEPGSVGEGSQVFDINAPCQKPTVKLTLPDDFIGTTGDSPANGPRRRLLGGGCLPGR